MNRRRAGEAPLESNALEQQSEASINSTMKFIGDMLDGKPRYYTG